MSLQETQTLIDAHFKCVRILHMMEANSIHLNFMRIEGVVNDRTAILIRQNEKLEAMHDNMVFIIADPSLYTRGHESKEFEL